ncbi:MAG: hypothetical protein V1660_02390 [archaeon]
MKIYQLETGSLYGKSVHPTVGDRRDWFYIPGQGIVVRRYVDKLGGKDPNYWFCKDPEKMKAAQDVISGLDHRTNLKLIGEIEIDNKEESILEEIIGHGHLYTSEQKRFVSKSRIFEKYKAKKAK